MLNPIKYVKKHWKSFWRRRNKNKSSWLKEKKYIWSTLCIKMCVCLLRILSKEKLCLKFSLLIRMLKGKKNNVFNIDTPIKNGKVLSKLWKKIQLVKIPIEDLKILIINVKPNMYQSQNLRIPEAQPKPHNRRNVLLKHYPSYNFFTFQTIKIFQVFQNPRKPITNKFFFTWQRNSTNHK